VADHAAEVASTGLAIGGRFLLTPFDRARRFKVGCKTGAVPE